MLQVPWHAFQEPSVLRHVAALTAAVWGFQGGGSSQESVRISCDRSLFLNIFLQFYFGSNWIPWRPSIGKD